MRNGVFLRCVLTCSLAGVLLACGDDSDDGGDGSAGDGGGGGSGGSGGGGEVEDPDPINADCPTTVGPFDGPYAMKGPCCYRRSNSARIEEFDGDAESSELVTLEYKAASFTVANHPATASNPSIKSAATDRFNKEEQAVLFRFELPREGGEWQAGKGTVRIGPGRYNCDEGTYSFYSDDAAPDTANWKDDGDRWGSEALPATIDPDAPAGEQIKVDWATNSNRGLSWLPYLVAAASGGKQPLDWETVSSGFDILEFPGIDEAVDCAGELDEIVWKPGAQTVSFIPIDLNNKDPISGSLGGITLSQLLAFLPPGAMKDLDKYNPETAERCMPGAGCDWLKLPDSLCPTTDAERENWGCHVGYEDNPDDVETKCTAAAPTGALNPDDGATSEGQCCDPLGESSSLPPCNAFYIVNDMVAAAVEITDDVSGDLQPPCSAP
jgi:hypothetical protein